MRVCFLALLILLAGVVCSADVIHLKDGGSIEGEVLSMDESELKVRLPYGMLAVNRADVSRIDLGEDVEPPAPKEPDETGDEKGGEKTAKPEIAEEPVLSLELPPSMPKPETMKNPRSAAMLAVIPGGGYAYLKRWDLALAAVGAEVALAGLGMSMASDEDQGKSSTGYILLGFAGLLKVAEILDCHDRAVQWNKRLDSGLDAEPLGSSSSIPHSGKIAPCRAVSCEQARATGLNLTP